jgi:hypothetical protein
MRGKKEGERGKRRGRSIEDAKVGETGWIKRDIRKRRKRR